MKSINVCDCDYRPTYFVNEVNFTPSSLNRSSLRENPTEHVERKSSSKHILAIDAERYCMPP